MRSASMMQPGTAPNNGTPWYQNSCITSALGKGALSVGVDSIGLIPEAGGVARMIGNQAGYAGVVADQFGANVLNAVGHTGTTIQGLNGLTDTSPTGLLSTGFTVAGFIWILAFVGKFVEGPKTVENGE